jgi:N-acetylglucosaminyldiphosphoundecaprenol N-acetyl-beta-D-mannosaminyltransferase
MTVEPPRYRLVDVEVDALTVDDLNRIVKNTIEEQEQRIIANHNVHSVYLYHRTPKMQALYRRADYVHIDGMSLVFLGQLLGLPLMKKHRVTYMDWVGPLLREACIGQWKLFYLGAKPKVVAAGTDRIRKRYPDIELAYHHGYFDRSPDSPENRSVITAINEFAPDVLMVGMGMPRQEKWIFDNADHLNACAILSSGACIDYIAGATPTPPGWAGKMGLEWLYRFLQEPRRLWYRNLVEPWPVLMRFFRDLVRRRLLQSSRR